MPSVADAVPGATVHGPAAAGAPATLRSWLGSAESVPCRPPKKAATPPGCRISDGPLIPFQPVAIAGPH